MKDKFRECGEVVYANVMRSDDGNSLPISSQCYIPISNTCMYLGRSKGWGIVEYESPEEVKQKWRRYKFCEFFASRRIKLSKN